MGQQPIWRIPPSFTLHWRQWDSELIVYHEQSGDTHRLNAIGAAALKLLADRPLTEPQLVGELSAALAVAADQDLSSTIHDLLLRLSNLGLIDVVHDAAEPHSPGPR